MWETQSGKLMTSRKVNIDFCLPNFSVTKIVTWKCHVEKSTNGRYDMILGRDLITTLGLDIIFSEGVIICRKIPYKGFLAPLVDVSNYDFKYITYKPLNRKNPL